jgi:hypothetical protein
VNSGTRREKAEDAAARGGRGSGMAVLRVVRRSRLISFNSGVRKRRNGEKRRTTMLLRLSQVAFPPPPPSVPRMRLFSDQASPLICASRDQQHKQPPPPHVPTTIARSSCSSHSSIDWPTTGLQLLVSTSERVREMKLTSKKGRKEGRAGGCGGEISGCNRVLLDGHSGLQGRTRGVVASNPCSPSRVPLSASTLSLARLDCL